MREWGTCGVGMWLALVLLYIGGGGCAEVFFEAAGEVLGVIEADLVGGFLHGVPAGTEVGGGFLEAHGTHEKRIQDKWS